MTGEIDILGLIKEYCSNNPDIDDKTFYKKIESLQAIAKKEIGIVELEHDLDIEVVTEIFIRINSKGVELSQADFVMSKIAANEHYEGSLLRKSIDYFCHLAVAPEFYSQIVEIDKEFAGADLFQKMTWLKQENDDLYDPEYTDLLRVAFTSEFNRGKLSDLVSLLSGRNFETKAYEEKIVEESFATLKKGILNFINETNFKRFLMIIKSAGFISPDLIRSSNALDFAYVVYLKLKSQDYNPAKIEKYVRRWLALSILTGRYSGSPESQFDYDIKNISSKNFEQYLASVENADLSDAFWGFALVQHLDTSASSSPYLNIYLAAQVKANDKGFLSKEITVKDLITHRGDIHHIFPKDYLKENGLKKGLYNQIANYVYMQSEINVQIGKKSPDAYFAALKKQCNGGRLVFGGIDSLKELKDNLKSNCIPEDIFEMNIANYEEFLTKRRLLIAQKIRDYYVSL